MIVKSYKKFNNDCTIKINQYLKYSLLSIPLNADNLPLVMQKITKTLFDIPANTNLEPRNLLQTFSGYQNHQINNKSYEILKFLLGFGHYLL